MMKDKRIYLKELRDTLQEKRKTSMELTMKIHTFENKIERFSAEKQNDMIRHRLQTAIKNKQRVLDELAPLKEEIKELRLKIFDIIDQLYNVKLAEILEAYLVEGMTFKEISENLENYSERHVYHLYSKALEVLKIDVD